MKSAGTVSTDRDRAAKNNGRAISNPRHFQHGDRKKPERKKAIERVRRELGRMLLVNSVFVLRDM